MPRTGRPATARAAFNADVLEGMLAVRATLDDVCDHFGISQESLRRNIRRHYGKGTTFESLSRRFVSRTRLSVRRMYLAAAMSRKPNGDPKFPALLRDAVGRFGDLPLYVQVAKDPEQHEEELAAQHHAATVAASTRDVEAQRVEKVMGLLAAALAPKR